MSESDILRSIINEFDIEKFENFFRLKNPYLKFPKEDIYLEDNDFSNGKKLAEGSLNDEKLIICSFLVNKELSERTGKKAQYELGKKILKRNFADAGIFIFYDKKGDFRFSLVYTNYLGKERDWSNFRRFTYFVSKNQTNKTFLKQIGEGDFSTLEKIKEDFSIEPVTKEFYTELKDWYFWAMDKVSFPTDYKYNEDPKKDNEIRNATNLIRLITRIIFIWFLKQKYLIPDTLFEPEELKNIVKDFNEGHNYYNTILQNLFFAVLNQKVSERGFVEEGNFFVNRNHYGVKTLFRYADKFLIPKEEALKLFSPIPFLNGGLFDCLDKEDENGKVIYIDGFSREEKKQALIPDELFFTKKGETVRGLIDILSNYNFTIDENTPIDQEIALDPELLGKVFENLLANYNPETATTARKATGSYYTPREIVDYMVEESLTQYLMQKKDLSEDDIRSILSYSDEVPNLNEYERNNIIEAISQIKIIDPACGSGAFPMGVLHKLVNALQKLDKDNELWHELQYQNALRATEEVFHKEDKKIREELLKEINDIFDESIHYPDYARKLYLVENCIYGVDIQPIAIQITKLRFFISLLLDQKVDPQKENYGIRPLPNLETKFVSANTLVGLEHPPISLYPKEIIELEDELKKIRHKYFQAKTRTEKRECQRKDRELREKLSEELKGIGYPSEISKKVADFDPYDQNATSEWFDPEWMFGVTDGFDIVIGNPPYIQLQKNPRGLTNLYENKFYETFDRRGDIYVLFYEKGMELLKDGGHLCYISSNKWMRAGYGEKLRKFFLKYNPKILIDLGPNVFESSTVDTNILLIEKSENKNALKAVTIDENKKEDVNIADILKNRGIVLQNLTKDVWFIGSDAEQRLKEKIEHIGKPLKDWDVKIYYGIKTGLNEAFIINSAKREEILNNCKDEEERRRTEAIIKPILRGRDIKRYYYEWAGLWVIIAKFGFYKQSYFYPAIVEHLKKYENELKNRGQCRYTRQNKDRINSDYTGQHHWLELDNNPDDYYLSEFEKEKVVWQRITHQPTFCLVDKNMYILDSMAFFVSEKKLKYLMAVLNSTTIFFYVNKIVHQYGFTGFRLSNQYVEIMPIPPITPANELIVKQIEALVDKILADKKENPNADTSELEREIDMLVYKLYDLTEEEIMMVEKNIK